MAVAHRLAEDDQVGLDVEHLVAPHPPAGPAEAGLHLVGEDEAAGRVDARGESFDVPGRWADEALGGEQRVEHHGGHPVARCGQRGDGGVDRGQRLLEQAARIGDGGGVGDVQGPYPRSRAPPPLPDRW